MTNRLKGPVRFRFREGEDLEVIIEGDARWVAQQVTLLGLEGVGWSMSHSSNSMNLGGGMPRLNSKGEVIAAPPRDMGPPPDPSRIPVVRRLVGSLNLHEKLLKMGVEAPQRPDPLEIAEILEELEEPPEPVRDPLSSDPMAEAWLKEIMRVAVRDFGVTGLSIEGIEKASQGRLRKTDLELEVWLDVMFRHGKLVKIHGGQKIGYGPSPKWLESKSKTII